MLQYGSDNFEDNPKFVLDNGYFVTLEYRPIKHTGNHNERLSIIYNFRWKEPIHTEVVFFSDTNYQLEDKKMQKRSHKRDKGR